MRLGVAWDMLAPGAVYRVLEPLRAMERLGHAVRWPAPGTSDLDLAALRDCDLVHVYRRSDEQTRWIVRELRAHGVASTWDNDDDLAATPPESPFYTSSDDAERIFRASVLAAKQAQIVSVTTDALARRYRDAGIQHVEVIPNRVFGGVRPRARRSGLVIGWIAGIEHRADASSLGIPQVLRRLQAAHPDLRVESIGVDLGLPERYRHSPPVPFRELPEHMARWDVGIAPLADIPFNHTRSAIKVAEYAASGVPWVASNLTPYAALGEDSGGRLVQDGEWFGALDALLRDPKERRRLASQGLKWARTQSIHDTASRWESMFRQAIELAHASEGR